MHFATAEVYDCVHPKPDYHRDKALHCILSYLWYNIYENK